MADEQTDGAVDTDGGTPAGGRQGKVRILLLFLGAFVLLLAIFREVLFPFLMAIYIAYLIEPVVARVVKSRLLGFKWTRGPTIVTLYVLILGGIFLLGWWGVVTLAKQVRTTAANIQEAVKEEGYRATFELQPKPETLSLDRLFPAGNDSGLLPRRTCAGRPRNRLNLLKCTNN